LLLIAVFPPAGIPHLDKCNFQVAIRICCRISLEDSIGVTTLQRLQCAESFDVIDNLGVNLKTICGNVVNMSSRKGTQHWNGLAVRNCRCFLGCQEASIILLNQIGKKSQILWKLFLNPLFFSCRPPSFYTLQSFRNLEDTHNVRRGYLECTAHNS